MNRAYATLEIKAVDDEARTITGIASTPDTDRAGDQVNPKGAIMKFPMPFLWQHDAGQPIGTVDSASVSAKGIEIVASIAKGVSAEIDNAWALIKSGLVRGLSIGFRSIDAEQIPNSYGMLFNKYEIMEISAVTIPANAAASIQTVKAFDTKAPAASGRVVRVPPPHVAGKTNAGIVRLSAPTPQEGSMNVQEQITNFKNARGEAARKMEAIMKKAADAGESLDTQGADEFSTIEAEIETIDKHLDRLARLEKTLATSAVRIPVQGDNSGIEVVRAQGASRGGHVEGESIVAIPQKLDKGIGFARFVKLMAMGDGNAREALEIAKNVYPNETPLHNIIKMHVGQGKSSKFIEKAAVDAALTSVTAWAGALVQYQNLAQDFIEYLRPQTLIGQIEGFTRVPFKVRVPRQTGGGTASWVGEGKAKPLTSLAFDTITLDFTKIATIAVLTDEVVRLSTPAAEALTRDQLAKAIIQQMDSDFIDPANAGTSNIKPASITNGVTPVVSTGTNTQAGIAGDIMNLVAPWISANMDPRLGVFVMTPTTAMALGLMTNSLGNKVFPDMTVNGGTIEGWRVVVSNAAGLVGASDGSHIVVLMNPSDILLADDGTVAVDASRETSLEMSDAPSSSSASGTGASLVSMFQTNSVAIRAERWINWVKGRSTSVQYLSGVHWGGYPS